MLLNPMSPVTKAKTEAPAAENAAPLRQGAAGLTSTDDSFEFASRCAAANTWIESHTAAIAKIRAAKAELETLLITLEAKLASQEQALVRLQRRLNELEQCSKDSDDDVSALLTIKAALANTLYLRGEIIEQVKIAKERLQKGLPVMDRLIHYHETAIAELTSALKTIESRSGRQPHDVIEQGHEHQ